MKLSAAVVFLAATIHKNAAVEDSTHLVFPAPEPDPSYQVSTVSKRCFTTRTGHTNHEVHRNVVSTIQPTTISPAKIPTIRIAKVRNTEFRGEGALRGLLSRHLRSILGTKDADGTLGTLTLAMNVRILTTLTAFGAFAMQGQRIPCL